MTYVNNRISAIGYGNASGLKWQIFQTDTSGTLLWSSPYIEPTPQTVSDSYPHYVLAKPTGEVIVTGVGGPTPDPFNPSFNQMPIVQYSNTGVQEWIGTPNIYAGTGLSIMFASDGSLYAIGSRNMYVFHYIPTALGLVEAPSDKIKIAPNPISGLVTIHIKSFDLTTKATIIDVTGKALLTFKLNSENNNLDLSSLRSGIYFCQIQSNSKTETIKIIKN